MSVADGKTRTSILSSFAQQTAIFSLKDVENMTIQSDFDFHEFQEKKSILYVKIPMKDNPVEALTATFFDQLISIFYDIADKHHGVLPKKAQFLLDEFANLGKINGYENVLSTCRGLGMEMITVVQDIAQLENKYGKEVTRSIINNHDTKLFLRTGDVETAKYFSGLAGDTTAKMKTNSSSTSGGIFTGGSASKSSQEQFVKRPLITDGELLRIERDKCYVFVSGFYPLELEKAWQYKVFKDFLFGKDRKPNYEKTYQETYMKQLDKIQEKYNKKNKIKEVIKEEQVINDDQQVFINTGNDGEMKEIDKEEVIITKTLTKPKVLETENVEVKKEEVNPIDESFDLLAQEFLMKGTRMNEIVEVPNVEEEISEQISEPIYDNQFGLEEVNNDDDVLGKIVTDYKEELEEDVETLKNIESENEIFMEVLENTSEFVDKFSIFAETVTMSEEDEEEFIKG
uniref:TrsK n=2 Tax=Aeromonas sp. Ne-1 TaxID=1675689 RepID=A0A0H4JD13_9GAMM|nr:TrsK [Aeromonas sp. Ne-1]